MKIYSYIIAGLFFVSCEKDQDEILSEYDSIMTLKVENDNAYADSFDKVKLIAEFPNDFITEDDGKVDFYIYKDVEEHRPESIRLIQEGGALKKISETYITHNTNESLIVKAVITVNGVQTAKTSAITFKKAFFDILNIYSSSLTVTHNSFSSIQLTTELVRNNGVVTLNSEAETTVHDISGNQIGLFNNYKNKTDVTGKIVNTFTLGNSNYTGVLYAITSSVNEQGLTEKDTLILFAN